MRSSNLPLFFHRVCRRRNISVSVALIAIFIGPVSSKADDLYAFTTYAGSEGFGIVDGAGTAARFGYPRDVAVDSSGTVYVSDYGNFTIRKITAAGDVTTIAGFPGLAGYLDGTGSGAMFNSTFGLAIDRNGTLLVADTGNSVIRRVTSTGVVTTVAGVPRTRGYLDGPATTAKFYGPEGLAVDAAGNIYVADTGNHIIRKIDTARNVTTIAGSPGVSGSANGVGSNAQFYFPTGLAVDAGGTVYVADELNHVIRKILPDGTVSTLAGLAGTSGAVDGTGATARFHSPYKIIFDLSGNLVVVDRDNDCIRRVTTAGVVTTIVGGLNSRNATDGIATSARFWDPCGIAMDATGTMWIADTNNSAIRKVSPNLTVTTIAGRSPIGQSDGTRSAAAFFSPQSLATDANGTVYVADTYNQTIRKITPEGVVSTIAGTGLARGSADGDISKAHFLFPSGIAVDASGTVFVADGGNHTIRKIAGGVVTTIAGSAGAIGSADGTGSAARFYSPQQIAIDNAGNIIVADYGNHLIRKVTPSGVVSTIAGSAGVAGTVDGVGAAARFYAPFGVAVDGSGNIYVSEQIGSVIRKIRPDNSVITLAGSPGQFATIDGTGTAARFDFPQQLALDKSGNLYVTDMITGGIRKITSTGVVTTIGGNVGLGLVNSLGSYAAFNNPLGIATDSFGSIYVADTDNCVIRKGALVSPANPSSAITNLSVRANVAANDRLIVGFSMNGSKSALIRAIGPGLAPFVGGITLAANPKLELFNGSTSIGSNDDWGGGTAIMNAGASVGAFPLADVDAAILTTVDGGRSAHCTTTSGGLGLVEVYDVGSRSSPTRLTNVSARYQVGAGSDVLVAGFVIQGSGPKTVLIRGTGPSLRALFGVSDAMADPIIKLYNSNQQVIATNDDWDPRIAPVFGQVGAFGMVGGSRDSVMMISLAPGLYSAELSGYNGGTGNGLIEVYEIGN